MDFGIIFDADNLALYGHGALTTAWLLLLSLVIGLVAAIPLSIMRVSRKRWISAPVWLYTYVIRGTPALLQLYIVYYGLAQFVWIRESFAWTALQSAGFCACLAFVINTCAYTTEMLAGAMKNTNHGEIEAAKSMGMSRALMLRRIIIPSAMRRCLPAYSNEVVMMLHATSLASTVTLLDITAAADRLYSTYYQPFEPFIFAGAIYVCTTIALTRLFKHAERRWLGHLQPRKSS